MDLFSQHCNLSLRAIDSNLLTVFQAQSRLMDSNDGRDAIFASNDGSMSHHAAYFGDESASGHEERGPSRVGAGADEDFSRREMYTAWVMHYMDNPFCNAWRNRTASDDIAGICFSAEAFIERASIT